MKDLISRSEVLETLKEVFAEYNVAYGGKSGGFAQAVPEAIKHIPTAYDVDKVVEQLESKSIPEDKVLYASSDKFGIYVILNDATEIVKAGGVNADITD